MLLAMRSKVGGFLAKAFIGLIVLSFIGWGIGDFVTGSLHGDQVAKVGDESISAGRVRQDVQRQAAQIRQMFGGNVPDNLLQAMNIEGSVIRQLVQESLLRQEAGRLNLYSDERIVTEIIAQNPAFRNEQGAFDRERFREALAAAGESEASYIQNLRQNLSVMFLVQGLTAMPVVSEEKLNAMHAFDGQRRIAEYIYLKPARADFAKAPDEAALKAYYDAHTAQFAKPELRDVSYIAFSEEDVPAQREVSEDQLRTEYKNRIQEFTKGETREVEQMLFDDEAAAKEANAAIKAGASFADAAKKAGFTEAQLKVGRVEKKELFDSVVEQVFALPENGTSDVIQSDAGYHIFHVGEILPGEVMPFETVKDQLKEEMLHVSASEGVYKLANAIEDDLASGSKLEEVAKKFDLKLQRVKGMGRGVGGKDLPDGPDFVQAAFETDKDAPPVLALAKDQRTYYVLRIDAVQPEAVQPFDAVRKEVAASYLREQADKDLKEHAAALADRLKKGEALSKIAASERLQVMRSDSLYRESVGVEDKFLPEEFVSQLFQVASGALPGAYPSSEGGYVVGRLAEIEPAPALDDKQRAQLRQQLEEGFLDDLLSQYTTYLQERYPVTIRKQPQQAPAQP